MKKKENVMAVNTGNKTRKGMVKDRTQIYNPLTGHYIKRDSSTGKFLDVKKDGTPFKGIRKEKTKILAPPNIDKVTAIKAEKAVIEVLNRKRSAQ